MRKHLQVARLRFCWTIRGASGRSAEVIAVLPREAVENRSGGILGSTEGIFLPSSKTFQKKKVDKERCCVTVFIEKVFLGKEGLFTRVNTDSVLQREGPGYTPKE